jgi:superfamily I DNA/RNA helicase
MSGAPPPPPFRSLSKLELEDDDDTIDLTGGDFIINSQSSKPLEVKSSVKSSSKSFSKPISSPVPLSVSLLDKKIETESRQFLALNNLTPSKEQAAVVKALIDGNHASVNAVAGSGKTTSVIMLAAYLHAEGMGRRILLLTYNKKLKEETRARIEKLGLKDIVEAHSFHAAGVKYYSDSCMRDEGLKRSVLLDIGWRKTPNRWDFVVIDEAQDVDRLKFAFVMKLIGKSLESGHGSPPQFLVIGDVRQSIYSYRGTDERFLRLSNQVWSLPEDTRPWSMLKLSTSFRISPSMADFVSEAMLQSEGYIVSSRPRISSSSSSSSSSPHPPPPLHHHHPLRIH